MRWLKLRPLAPQMLPGVSMQFPINLNNGATRNRMFIRSWDKNCLQVKICTTWTLLLEALMSTFHQCRISFTNFLTPGGGVKMKKCSVSATSPSSDLYAKFLAAIFKASQCWKYPTELDLNSEINGQQPPQLFSTAWIDKFQQQLIRPLKNLLE